MSELVDSPGLEYTEKKPWRWPTVLFAALPATFLAFPAGMAILAGFLFLFTMQSIAFPLLLGGALGWVGMISLWAAARSSGVVTRRTARGLAGGIVGNLIIIGFNMFNKDVTTSQWFFMAVLTIGPLLFSISHLWHYWNHPRPVEREHGEDPLLIDAQSATVSQTRQTDTRPFNEVRMRRILVLLLIIPAILELVFVSWILHDQHPLGNPPGIGLFLFVPVVPFFLGIVVTAVWCFCRSRPLRGLAVATLLTPVLLPGVLSIIANLFGHGVTSSIACYTAVAIPMLIVLFLPRQVANYMPHWVLNGQKFNKMWVVFLKLMLIPWVILIIGVILSFMLNSNAVPYLVFCLLWHIGASSIVAVISLVMAYIGWRAQQHPQKLPRSAQIGLSVLHLLIAVPPLLACWFFILLGNIG